MKVCLWQGRLSHTLGKLRGVSLSLTRLEAADSADSLLVHMNDLHTGLAWEHRNCLHLAGEAQEDRQFICFHFHWQKIVHKGDECILKDNNERSKWYVTGPGGVDMLVPSVGLIIPPPNPLAVDLSCK